MAAVRAWQLTCCAAGWPLWEASAGRRHQHAMARVGRHSALPPGSAGADSPTDLQVSWRPERACCVAWGLAPKLSGPGCLENAIMQMPPFPRWSIKKERHGGRVRKRLSRVRRHHATCAAKQYYCNAALRLAPTAPLHA